MEIESFINLNNKDYDPNLKIDEFYDILDRLLENRSEKKIEYNDILTIHNKIINYIKYWTNSDNILLNNINREENKDDIISECIQKNKRIFIKYAESRLRKLDFMKTIAYLNTEDQQLDINKNYLAFNIYYLLDIFYKNGRISKKNDTIHNIRYSNIDIEYLLDKNKIFSNKNENEYNKNYGILTEYLGLLLYAFSLTFINIENRIKHTNIKFKEFLDFLIFN